MNVKNPKDKRTNAVMVRLTDKQNKKLKKLSATWHTAPSALLYQWLSIRLDQEVG